MKFAGINSKLSESRFAIIPVPYEGSVSFYPGTRFGPERILYASRELENYEFETGLEPTELGFHVFDPVSDELDPKKIIEETKLLSQQALENKSIPIVLGGEHTVSLGNIYAVLEKHPDTTILQIDAHADLRYSYQGSMLSHACVMRRVRERTDSVVQVGIRSISKAEIEYLRNSGKEATLHPVNFDLEGIQSQLSDKIYITIDLDGLDPSEAPGVGTPQPGGIRYLDLLKLLKSIIPGRTLLGFDIVELRPMPYDPRTEMLAADLLYKVSAYSLLNRLSTDSAQSRLEL